MEKKILMVSTASLLSLLLASLLVLSEFSVAHSREARREQMESLQLYASYGDPGTGIGIGVRRPQLSLELPKGLEEAGVSVENDYRKRKVILHIPEAGEDYLDGHPFVGRMDHIKGIRMEDGLLELAMDGVYEVQSSVEGGWLHLDLLAPWQVYETIIVIDAGHGGSASGDTKQQVMEKDLNLSIVRRLKSLLEGNGGSIGVYYTRTEDKNPSYEERIRLAEEVRADFFLTIHSNSSADGQMSEENGTEVMYDEAKGDGSQQLAGICLEEVSKALGSKANGVFPGNRDYLLRSSKVPTVSIEVGYMTNQEELQKLASSTYQRQAAQGIYNAILRAAGAVRQ